MDMRSNLDQLLEEEPIITQEKIKNKEEEKANMVHGGANEDNEIILDLKGKEVESKSTLKVCYLLFLVQTFMLSIVLIWILM